MNTITIQIENLKCQGCATTITSGLMKFEEIENISIDIEKSLIDISYDGHDNNSDKYIEKLARLGYPQIGENNTISIAKSYVSCAIGKVKK